eukprot:4472001-Amphidinium_carterae.1
MGTKSIKLHTLEDAESKSCDLSHVATGAGAKHLCQASGAGAASPNDLGRALCSYIKLSLRTASKDTRSVRCALA